MFVSYHSFIVSHYRHLIFGLMLTFCSCLGQMFFISLFGEDFRQHLNLTYSELGWIYSMTTLMSGVFLLWLAPKIDSYKVSYFTFATLAILISAMLLISQVENLFIFFMVLFCLRFCSQAILSHIAMTSTARIFPLNRGKAIGIISVGFSLGEASLPLLMVTLSTYFTWQQIWKILASFLILIVLPTLLYIVKKNSFEESVERKIFGYDVIHPVSWTLVQVLKDRKFYLLLPALLSPTLILTGAFFSHIPLVTEKNWDLSLLASCFAIFALSNLFASLYFGKKIDEKGCIALMPYILPLLGLGIFSLGFVPVPSLSIGFYMFCIGMAVGGNRVILNTIWAELYGVKNLGEIRGVVVFLCIICAGISPSLFGYLLDKGVTMKVILTCSCVYIMFSMFAVKGAKV